MSPERSALKSGEEFGAVENRERENGAGLRMVQVKSYMQPRAYQFLV
jgi:hypothetical protein